MTYASLPIPTIRTLIEIDEAMLKMLARETDHVSPAMLAAHRRIEQAEAEITARTVSSFWKPPEVRR